MALRQLFQLTPDDTLEKRREMYASLRALKAEVNT